MDLASLKKEIKEWERSFRAKHGRDPTVDEIKQLGYADKYKQYKKLTKDASNKAKSRPLLSPARPAPSKTQPLPGFNPFSPQKNNKGKQKAIEFKLPALNPDPFDDPSVPTPIARARKRLRGEPVSPSPNKGKRRRVAQDSDGDEDDSAEANSSLVFDSPEKPSAGSFKLLFDEKPQKLIFPSLRGKTLLSSPVQNISLLSQDAMDIDTAEPSERDPFFSSPKIASPNQEMVGDMPPPPVILLPPSPPPTTKNSSQSQGSKPRGKASNTGRPKKTEKKIVSSDDESEAEAHKVRVFRRAVSRRADDFDNEDDAFLRRRRPPESDLQSTEAESTTISLPDNLREILSLTPNTSTSRTRDDKLVVEQLIYGAHRSNYDPSKGGEVWGVGEFEGEQLDDMAPRNTDAGDEEDDWEGEGVPWEVGEL
ncbi:hypothetical protein MIND_00511500 [Mycena indigotica]|uniref:DNA replication regulator SLD2 n=1 Tax=Mycena indigotica TaxID=2126181 RepID=A0A8H6WCB5_9AGAR|nr:uncharacterized protein MIND_00511500 [Mycena indigotica]KAF7307179.1 hypothetical protein MIND_00511500 [Mycena indigotica]